jgi:PKD domain
LLRRAFAVVVLGLVAVGLLASGPASAEPGFEYGEVTRFGGFDRSAYNGGQYGGALTPGRFLDPTGFAVDPVDNTVYVVDRTSYRGQEPATDWRIQQFSPAGVLTGATMFTLPNGNTAASAIDGLAVDHRAGRLYALVVGSPPVGGSTSWPVAQELLAWSTTPMSGGLVAASTGEGEIPLPPDAVGSLTPGSSGTVGGVVSSAAQLLSGASPLYAPQGIAVDPLETSGVDNPVAIEASDLSPAGAGHPLSGDTIVQQVATQSHGSTATGDLLSSWSGASVASQLENSSWGPRSISTGPDGTLTVMLNTNEFTSTNAFVVRLNADFSAANVLENNQNVPPLGDFDQSPMYTNEWPYNRPPGVNISDPGGAGPQVVHLDPVAPDSVTGAYAAVIFTDRPGDYQVSSTATAPGPEYWTSGEDTSENFEANIGIRLLESREGAITDLRGRTIVNTLGNGAESGPCKIGASNAALAAGAGGTLWILDRGPRAAQPNASGQGREVIELAPSAGQLCPQPFGTFKMTPSGGQSKTGEETLTVPAGTQVTFDTSSINRRHGKPFAYEWDIDGDSTNGPAKDGFEKVYEMTPPKYYYPPSKVTYMYTRPGEYKVRMRMRTDYGIYTPPHPGTVIVTPALTHPEARFTATPSGGQQVTFNAAGSAPGVGTIVDYHWNWGDSTEEDEDPQTPVVVHSYAQPGEYQVKLTVTNSAYQSVTSAPLTVTITAPAHQATTPPVLTGPLYAIPPFTLYPIPSVPAGRSPTRLSPRARFSGGSLSVTIACPATKKLCAGTVSIETATALAAQKARKVSKKPKRKPSRQLLGYAAFSIPGGRGATVKVRLSAKGMALLKSRKRLKVLVVVSAHDSLGDPGTATLSMTLKAPAPRGGHAKR